MSILHKTSNHLSCLIQKTLSILRRLARFIPVKQAKQPALSLSASPKRTVCLSILRAETTQKNPRHRLHPWRHRRHRKTHCWPQGQSLSFSADHTEGFLTGSLRADIRGRAHLSLGDLWTAAGPDVDLSTLAVWREADVCVSKGGAERCSTRGDSPFSRQYLWTAGTLKARQVLKSRVCALMCRTIYLLHCPNFMWLGLQLSWPERKRFLCTRGL